MDLKMRKMKNMESKQTPLTLVEAEHEFGKVARAFGTSDRFGTIAAAL
jgi:hypothetical protein